jgi:hypothetical protein
MFFIRTPEVGTNPGGQFLCCQQPIGLHNVPFAMHPVGFHRIEPGTLAGQGTHDNPYATARLLHLPVMAAQPLPDFATVMPRGIIPHQEQGGGPALLPLGPTPGQKGGGDGTHGAAGHEPQPDLFRRRLWSAKLSLPSPYR